MQWRCEVQRVSEVWRNRFSWGQKVGFTRSSRQFQTRRGVFAHLLRTFIFPRTSRMSTFACNPHMTEAGGWGGGPFSPPLSLVRTAYLRLLSVGLFLAAKWWQRESNPPDTICLLLFQAVGDKFAGNWGGVSSLFVCRVCSPSVTLPSSPNRIKQSSAADIFSESARL